MEDRHSFGAWVRRRRRALDLTQAALAARIGVATITVQKIEADERRPSAQVAALLAERLGVPAAERERFLQAARAELAVDRLPAEYLPVAPPSAASGLTPGYLPVPLTTLIGREATLRQLSDLLYRTETRLVTLTGPGGVGKTRLALAAAGNVRSQFPDGAWFVDLAPVVDTAQVAATIARDLRATVLADMQPLVALRAFLATKRLLLVLDNCEQVVDAAAALVVDLLQAAPGLRILTTSRVALHVSGEHELPAPPLEVPAAADVPDSAETPAVRLFVERARAARPGFALDATSAPAVRELCRRLDGLPLAIELAAARVKLLSPAALLARLVAGGQLPVLTAGPRDLPARQQTVRATIAWSEHLLPPAERALLAQLSVFAGNFDAAAVAAVCQTEGAFEQLASLVGHSLLQAREGPAGEPRFALLETVREYAQERLREEGATEADRLSARHAAYYANWIEAVEPKLRAVEQLDWLARVDVDDENLNAALGWCFATMDEPEPEAARARTLLGVRLVGSLWEYWSRRSRYQEWKRWSVSAEAAIARLVPTDDQETLHAAEARAYARALLAAQELAYILGTITGSAARLQQAEQLARRSGDARTLAHALALRFETDPAAAEAPVLLEEALQHAQAAGAADIQATLLLHRASRLAHADVAQARACDDTALASARTCGDRWRLGWILCGRGQHAGWFFGEGDQMAQWFEEALELARAVDAPLLRANALAHLEWHALYRGDYRAFVALNQERLAIERSLGNIAGVAHCLHEAALAAGDQGAYDQAAAFFDEGFANLRELGEHWIVCQRLLARAGVAVERGQLDAARALLAEATTSNTAHLSMVQDAQSAAQLAWVQGDLARVCGEVEVAEAHYQTALSTMEAADWAPVARMLLRYAIARGALAAGEYDRAERELAEISGQMDQHVILAVERAGYQLTLAQLHLARGRHSACAERLNEGLMLARRIPALLRFAQLLECAGALAAEQRQPRRAAAHWGCAHALREQIGAPMWPVDRPEYERRVAACRAALGDTAFDAAWASGRALTWEQAVDEALADWTMSA